MSSFKNFARKTQPLAWTTPKKAGSTTTFDIFRDLKPGDRIEYWCTYEERWKSGIFTRYGDTTRHTWETPDHIWAHWENYHRETYVSPPLKVRLAKS